MNATSDNLVANVWHKFDFETCPKETQVLFYAKIKEDDYEYEVMDLGRLTYEEVFGREMWHLVFHMEDFKPTKFMIPSTPDDDGDL